MQHAAGVGWLIQQRGPGAYSDEWDWSMLHSFRPIMVRFGLSFSSLWVLSLRTLAY